MNIMELAIEAGIIVKSNKFNISGTAPEAIERFAALVRAKALEEAAKLCDEEAKAWARLNAQDEEGFGATQCAAAIRGLK